MADETPEREAATSTADLYQRHSDADASQWEEQPAVTDRPNDLVKDKVVNTTFAERAKAQTGGENKAVQAADNKALDDMTKDELFAEAERRGVEVKKSSSKPDLVKALS